jgi:hypothetical protein
VKRAGQLIEQVADLENLALAFWRAARGKAGNPEVEAFRANLAEALSGLRQGLLSAVGVPPSGGSARRASAAGTHPRAEASGGLPAQAGTPTALRPTGETLGRAGAVTFVLLPMAQKNVGGATSRRPSSSCQWPRNVGGAARGDLLISMPNRESRRGRPSHIVGWPPAPREICGPRRPAGVPPPKQMTVTASESGDWREYGQCGGRPFRRGGRKSGSFRSGDAVQSRDQA